MGGRLRNLALAGSGLVAILGIGGGCETPGGAMLMSALGAASLAKGGTPKQMALAGAYKNIGDASLAYQASKREAEAIENAGQNIGEGLRASSQGAGEEKRNIQDSDSEGAGFIMGAATESFNMGERRTVKFTPFLRDKFRILSWSDKNRNNRLDDGEAIDIAGLIDLESTIRREEEILIISGFGRLAFRKVVLQTLRNDKGDVIYQGRCLIGGEDTPVMYQMEDGKEPLCYYGVALRTNAGFFFENAGKKINPCQTKHYFLSYEVGGEEVYTKEILVQMPSEKLLKIIYGEKVYNGEIREDIHKK